ncbi:MAG TPA: ABC transporter permease, partial [Halothiobacillus sp.]|nr:ABC transporter permease [Halothiobacillus sp.]
MLRREVISMSRLPASFEVDLQAHRLTLIGDWTVHTLDRVRPRQVAPLAAGEVMTLSTDQLGAMDTAGAMLLHDLFSQLESAGGRIDRSNLNSTQRSLLELVAQRRVDGHESSEPRENWLAQIGRASVGSIREGISYLNFLGELTIRLVPQILRPWQIRWREVINEIALAGVQALFIVGLLSFLIGMVLAYQGGATLKQYGANILIVDM